MKQFYKLYIAGASKEIERPEKWIARAREAGFEITFDWTGQVRYYIYDHPELCTEEINRQSAINDMDAILEADVLWNLASEAGGTGQWWEQGFAYGLALGNNSRGLGSAWEPRILVSGAHARTIFSLLPGVERFDTDEEAFERLLQLKEGAG